MFQWWVSIYNETFGTYTYIMVKVLCFVLKHKRGAWLRKYIWSWCELQHGTKHFNKPTAATL